VLRTFTYTKYSPAARHHGLHCSPAASSGNLLADTLAAEQLALTSEEVLEPL